MKRTPIKVKTHANCRYFECGKEFFAIFVMLIRSIIKKYKPRQFTLPQSQYRHNG